MTGGKISGNIANYGGGYSSSFNSSGGGVYVGGNFTMTGGEISGNSVCGSGDYRKGGGVFFSDGHCGRYCGNSEQQVGLYLFCT
jgi:hypothetical protein